MFNAYSAKTRVSKQWDAHNKKDFREEAEMCDTHRRLDESQKSHRNIRIVYKAT